MMGQQRRRWRRRLGWGLLAVSALALGAIAVLWLTDDRPSSDRGAAGATAAATDRATDEQRPRTTPARHEVVDGLAEGILLPSNAPTPRRDPLGCPGGVLIKHGGKTGCFTTDDASSTIAKPRAVPAPAEAGEDGGRWAPLAGSALGIFTLTLAGMLALLGAGLVIRLVAPRPRSARHDARARVRVPRLRGVAARAPALPGTCASLAEGSRFGAYRVGELIGSGAMGVVYHARHDALDRSVALKLLSPALAADARIHERLRREALHVGRLHHPNVVAVYDAGMCDGRAYIAMQLVVGRSLHDLVGTPQLTCVRMVEVLTMVAAGLDHAHERGVVHRDVKPQNILVEDATGRALLADFGIAAAAGHDRLTRVGDVVGTVAYAAPEQLAGADPHALHDVYALGCVLFELLTGHLPFERPTLPGAIHAHQSEPAPAVSSLRRDLAGGGIDAVVLRALAKDPRERWQSAGALALAARDALPGAEAVAPQRTRSPGDEDDLTRAA